MNTEERFNNKIKKMENGCHIWTGAITQAGYGQFGANGIIQYAHRIAYEQKKGKIPEGLEIDHLCRNRSCVNPEHLEAVTCRENIHRGISLMAQRAKQTHCKRGHLFSEDNTYRDHRGYRECKICKRLRNQEYNKKIMTRKQ